jgi:hypothetical protein
VKINKINDTRIMTKKAKAKSMIASPDWIVSDPDVLDVERQLYMTLALEQKFNAAAEAGDVTRLYEIIFHFLNINALTADHKLYDQYFKEIRENDRLATFIRDMREEDSRAEQIMSQANQIYTRILTRYISMAINVVSGAEVLYFDPKNIHHSNVEVYVIFNVKPHSQYELWKAEFKSELELGNDMSKLCDIEIKEDDISDFKSWVRAYNRKNPVSRIRSGNFVAVTCETATDSMNVVSVIKDIILLSKIFYEKNQFNPKVLSDISKLINEKKTFPFKLQLH